MTIDSLPKLIERLVDPHGDSSLVLHKKDLQSILKYEGVDDFAATYIEFLDAIKANNTVTQVAIYGFFEQADKGGIFPIINPLLRYLPRANAVKFPLVSLSGVERFLCKDAAAFTTVKITNLAKDDDATELINNRILQLHPDLEVFKYTNASNIECYNDVIGSVLLSLPVPIKLRELSFVHDPYNKKKNCEWSDEVARPFTSLELNRLMEVVQASTLTKLTLQGIRFSSKEECNQFARGLAAASQIKELRLSLFTPDAGNYRDIVNVVSKMPHLEFLDALFALDEWRDGGPGSFSIPIGDIVRGAPKLKKLRIGQDWKPLDMDQCSDLAMALRSPLCGLKGLGIGRGGMGERVTTVAGAATIMSSFSSPPSSIGIFSVRMVIEAEDDFDSWLRMLPRTTALRTLELGVDRLDIPVLTRLQQEEFLRIVSGWYYLTRILNLDDDDSFFTRCLSGDCYKQLLTLMQLNKAGRHYLTSQAGSKADGVEVLVKVRQELDALYTHLLENPCLCDRGVATLDGRTRATKRTKPRTGAPKRKKPRTGATTT